MSNFYNEPEQRKEQKDPWAFAETKHDSLIADICTECSLSISGSCPMHRGRTTPAERWNIKQTVKEYKPPPETEIVINCLHYTTLTEGGKIHDIRKGDMGPIATWVTMLGILWVVTTIFFVGFKNTGSFYYFFKLIPLVLLPLFATARGITHIRLSQDGIQFQSRAENTVLKETKYEWWEMSNISFIPPTVGKPLSEGSVVFRKQGAFQKKAIKLSKIGNSHQWKRLLEGIARWSNVPTSLDPNLFETNLSVRDPSFTSLWLDALVCPPQRQRLEPLPAGMTLQAGAYQIFDQLGQGGQGRAYLAESSAYGKVVLKEYILPVYVEPHVRKKALLDFETEATTLKQLHHVNIVRLFDSFFEDHRAYLVMEFIDGRSLKNLVKEQGPLEEGTVVEYARKMCEILKCLHEQAPPLVHRDFTPDNLLLSKDGTLKLIDFTAAKRGDPGEPEEVSGKYHYMPPEQFRGQSSPSSDLYALGCTLFFLLTGEEPEPITTSFPMLVRRDVSAKLNDIVVKCTALDARDRFLNAAEIEAALIGIRQGAGESPAVPEAVGATALRDAGDP